MRTDEVKNYPGKKFISIYLISIHDNADDDDAAIINQSSIAFL